MSEQSKPPEGEGFSHEATPPAAGAAGAGSAGKTGSLRRAPVIAGAVALVMTGGIAALAGTGMLGSNAKQPEDVLPGDSIIFAKADLDPGAAQKVSAFRLLDKLPDAKKALSAEDPKKAVFEWAKSKDPDMSGVDYAADIEPWLGDRVGMSVLAPQGSDKEPVVVMALAVKDEAKAKEGIARLQAKTKDAVAKVKDKAAGASASPTKGGSEENVQIYKDGYLLLTEKKNESRVRAALEQPTLAANETFKTDMAALGETGVASGWVDGTQAMKLSGTTSMPAAMEELAGLSGRSAYALRFSSDYLELAQVNRGMKVQTKAAPLKDVTNLPADTGAFYSFSGGSDYLGELWPTIKKFAAASGAGDVDEQLKAIEQQTGLVLPADAQTLLGKQLDVVVAKQDFKNLQAMPKVGLRLWTDTAKAQSIIDKLVKLGNSQGTAVPVQTRVSGEHLDVGLDSPYLSALGAGGDLSSAPGLKTVLPDLDKSVGALYVDLDAYESQYLDEVPAEQRELVKALQAVGMTSQPVQDGEQHSTLRVSVN